MLNLINYITESDLHLLAQNFTCLFPIFYLISLGFIISFVSSKTRLDGPQRQVLFHRLYLVCAHISYVSFLLPTLIGFMANVFSIKNMLFIQLSSSGWNFFHLTLDCCQLYFIILGNLIAFLTILSFYTQTLDMSFYKTPVNTHQLETTSGAWLKSYDARVVEEDEMTGKLYFLFFIISLQTILHILFTTNNILVFFLMFEMSILPLFAIIGFFGKRSLKFKAMNYLLYFTLFSAVPLLLSIIFIIEQSGATDYSAIKFFFFTTQLPTRTLCFLFLGFFIPFGVKLALFPFHTWLPEAHVEASTEGSMLLSGIMLKLGFYGFIKFCLGFFSSYIILLMAPYLLTVIFIGAFTTSFSLYKQLDIKKIIAYSSIVHMNIAIFGFFCVSKTALQGGLLFAFSHGISSAGLFCAVGYLHDKIKTRNLLEISGLWSIMPRWSSCFLILLLANAGMPGTIGFIAETALILGIFENFPITGFILFIPLAITAYRNYFLFTQVCLGVPVSYLGAFQLPAPTKNIRKTETHFISKDWDISYTGEGVVIAFVAFFSVCTGICPQYFIALIEWTATCYGLQWLPLLQLDRNQTLSKTEPQSRCDSQGTIKS